MSSQSSQTSIIGEPSGDHVRIETNARTIRPYLELPAAFVDECKLDIHPDHVSITAVDPANVGMVHATIHRDAFDEFEIQGTAPFTVGVNLDRLRSQLRTARLGKRTNDSVALGVDETRTRVEIERDYTRSTIQRTDEFLNLDPDSVRKQPELPDLELHGHAELDAHAFQDAVEACDSVSDTIRVTDHGEDLILASSETNSGDVTRGTRTRAKDAVLESHDGGGSLFSLDYVKDTAAALIDGKIDHVTIRYDEEFPARFIFERSQDDTVLYDGEFFVAPRIEDDGGDV